MADLLSLLVLASCLGLFVAVLAMNAPRNAHVEAGYRSAAVLLCWSLLGFLPAGVILLLGAGVALWARPQAERPVVMRRVLASGLALLAAAGLLMLVAGTPSPLQSPRSPWPVISGALLVGYVAGRLAESLLLGQKLDPPQSREAILELVLLLLILALPPVIEFSNPAMILPVIGLLGLQVLYLRDLRAAQTALRRRTQEISLLNNVGQFTSDNLNLDDVLWNIYEHVVQLIDVSIFYIMIHDEEREMLEFRLVVADGRRLNWHPRKVGEGTATYLIRHKKPLHVTASERARNPELQHYTATVPYMDYLGVPLLVGATVVGVMAVMSTEREDAFGPEEIQILQTVANQVGLAVRNALLYTRQTELVDKLSLINQSVFKVLFNTHREDALEAACQTALDVSGASKVAIFLVEDAQMALKIDSGLTDAHRSWLQANLPPLPEQVRIVSNLAEETDAALRESSMLGAFQTLAELPLRSGRITLGMLAVYYDMPHFFRKQDVDLLAMLANQIAAMLENVQLFELMELYADEMSQLVQLLRISTSSLNLSTVMRDIAQALREMMDVSRVAIIALEAEASRARLLATVNHTVSEAPNAYLPLFPELADMAQSAPPVVRAYQHTDAGLSPDLVQQMKAHDEQTISLVPLYAENELLGVVLLGSHATRHFTVREWHFIEMVTHQITAQINNIRLHDQIQRDLDRRLAEMAVIEDIAQQVSSSLDFNQVINHVLEAAIKATQADMAALALVTDADQVWVIEQRVLDEQSHLRYQSQNRQLGLFGQVLREGGPIIVPDNQQAAFYYSDYPGAYHASLAVPLMKEGAMIGVLKVESEQANAFSTEHTNFLSSLAGHAVMSIENARFLEERRNEIALLRSLRDLSLWLVSVDDSRSVGHEILRAALQLLQGKQAALYEYEADHDNLRVLATLWPVEQEDAIATEALPAALAREAVRSGELTYQEDVRVHPAAQAGAAFDYDSAVAVPLKQARGVLYVMVLTFDGRRTFMERDLNTIDLLASQAIGHLKNARLHERIRAGRDQMRAILDSTRSGMILLDREVCLIETNPSAHRLLGIDLSPHLGEYFPDVLLRHIEQNGEEVYTRDRIAQLVETLRARPDTETAREFTRQVGSQRLYVQETGLPVRDAQGEIIGRLLVLQDITEARLLEEQREDFADMLVHDLRGPLGAIQSSMELVLPRLSQPEDEADNAILIKSSAESAARLLRLVETLLDISKMQHAGLELRRETVPLPVIVETAFASLRTLAQEAGITLRVRLPADLPPLCVDPEKVERVLINLLDNAVRYSPAGGEIRLTGQLVEAGKWVEVCVVDAGPGILPERRVHIFERFRRLPGQLPSRGHKGHGLGLTFVRLVIEQHGGTIRVEDDDELPGACFVFRLPTQAAEQPSTL